MLGNTSTCANITRFPCFGYCIFFHLVEPNKASLGNAVCYGDWCRGNYCCASCFNAFQKSICIKAIKIK